MTETNTGADAPDLRDVLTEHVARVFTDRAHETFVAVTSAREPRNLPAGFQGWDDLSPDQRARSIAHYRPIVDVVLSSGLVVAPPSAEDVDEALRTSLRVGDVADLLTPPARRRAAVKVARRLGEQP